MIDTKFLDGLITILFQPDTERLLKIQHNLASDNVMFGGSHYGFLHHGQVYTSDLKPPYGTKVRWRGLHESLVARMEDFLADQGRVEADKKRIRQTLSVLLMGCQSLQDVRDALPDFMQDLVVGCESLSRTRPEAYTLVDNPRALNQYMKMRDKIEFYRKSRQILKLIY